MSQECTDQAALCKTLRQRCKRDSKCSSPPVMPSSCFRLVHTAFDRRVAPFMPAHLSKLKRYCVVALTIPSGVTREYLVFLDAVASCLPVLFSPLWHSGVKNLLSVSVPWSDAGHWICLPSAPSWTTRASRHALHLASRAFASCVPSSPALHYSSPHCLPTLIPLLLD